jgi:prevent-host-death family protein
MPRTITATSARSGFAETVNRAIYARERVVVKRHGKDVAAVVPIEDLHLLEAIEDRIDIDAARKALKEKGSVPWAKVKARLKL